jgi:hypothetical protein
MAQTTSINLLRASQSHFWENFLKWALTTGRFLIILTQTIALAAFVYRFSLDREIIDLADSIKQNQAIVGLYKNEEAKYQNLHERLVFADTLVTPQANKTVLLKEFVRIAQGKVIFNAIDIGETSVTVEAAASSTGALSSFLAEIKKLNEIKSVSVNSVENKATNGVILIGITAELTNGKETSLPDESN